MTPREEAPELLPCPFCGGVAESDSRQAYRALSSGRLGNRFAIYCTSCNADMGFCYEDIESENHEAACEEIITAWNTRTQAAAAANAREEGLREAGDVMRDRLLAFVSALALETDCGPDVDAITAWDVLLGRKATGRLNFARAALSASEDVGEAGHED